MLKWRRCGFDSGYGVIHACESVAFKYKVFVVAIRKPGAVSEKDTLSSYKRNTAPWLYGYIQFVHWLRSGKLENATGNA